MGGDGDLGARDPWGGAGDLAATDVAAHDGLGFGAGLREGEGGVRLTLAHLYPDLLNIYGDRGNVLALVRRAAWRGIELTVRPVRVGEGCDWAAVDLACIGGGEDGKQAVAAADLVLRGEGLRAAVAAGLALLAVCGGYQLLGQYYQPAQGARMEGIGVFDAHTVAGGPRLIGNVVVDGALGSLVGFENHSGRTALGPGAVPLGRLRGGRGGGNNGRDGGEGCWTGHCIGTYLHGSLLPKNPVLADFLLRGAVARRYGPEVAARVVTPLPDAAEALAHRVAEGLARRRRRGS